MAETSRSSWRTLWFYGNIHWSKAGTGTVIITIPPLMLHVQQVVAITQSFHCMSVIYEVMLCSVVYQYFLNGKTLLIFVKKTKSTQADIFKTTYPQEPHIDRSPGAHNVPIRLLSGLRQSLILRSAELSKLPIWWNIDSGSVTGVSFKSVNQCTF